MTEARTLKIKTTLARQMSQPGAPSPTSNVAPTSGWTATATTS